MLLCGIIQYLAGCKVPSPFHAPVPCCCHMHCICAHLQVGCSSAQTLHSASPPSAQHPEGGFGGGPYQLAHLAPTYAAVAALVALGGEDALSGEVGFGGELSVGL